MNRFHTLLSISTCAATPWRRRRARVRTIGRATQIEPKLTPDSRPRFHRLKLKYWVGGFGFRGPGIHPNPTLDRMRPNPESISVVSKCPYEYYSSKDCTIPQENSPGLRGCSESTRIHPNSALLRIRNPQPSFNMMNRFQNLRSTELAPLQRGRARSRSRGGSGWLGLTLVHFSA